MNNIFTFRELCEHYQWPMRYISVLQEKLNYAAARGVKIKVLEERGPRNALLFQVVEEYPVYTREEIIKKYNLTTLEKNPDTKVFIKYCKGRGINIEKAGLKGIKVSYRIIDDTNYCFDNEVWKEIPETYLMVSNLGRVKNKDGKIKTLREIQGYLYVTDGKYKKTWRVHRLVLMAFNPIKNNQDFDVDHINGIKNDNRLENLRWVSSQRNIEFRDNNQNKIGAVVSELIQKYGYEEIYQYLLDYSQKRKSKA